MFSLITLDINQYNIGRKDISSFFLTLLLPGGNAAVWSESLSSELNFEFVVYTVEDVNESISDSVAFLCSRG